MNKEDLRRALRTNTHDRRLSLPIEALQSPPVTQQLAAFLASQPFQLDGVAEPVDSGGALLLSGTGANGPFQGIPLEARFIADDPVRLILRTTQNRVDWALASSFPRMKNTLGSWLLFDDARIQFASQVVSETGISTGLWFKGKLKLSGSLGLYLFLVGSKEMVFSGQITAGQNGIPEMQLSTEDRDGASLGFFVLGPIRLRLVSQAVLSARRGAAAHCRMHLEFHSSIRFTSQGRHRSIPLAAHIYDPKTSIRLDADLTQGIDAALDEIKALLNSVSINTLSFGDFRLEDVIKLTQLTIYLNPSADTKVSHVALSIQSARSWPLIKDQAGTELLKLEEISVTVGMGAPFAAGNLSAYLEGKIRIGSGLLILSIAASATGVALRGYLDNGSHLALGDLVRHFVNRNDTDTPPLRIDELDILVEPGSHYALDVKISDLWSIALGGQQKFSLDEVGVHLSYTTGSRQTEVELSCLLTIGGAELALTATYSTTGGWDVRGGLVEGQAIGLDGLLADLEEKFGIALPEFLHGTRLDTFVIHFNTSKKDFDFEIGGDIPVEGGRLKGVITLKVRQVTAPQGNKLYEFSLGGWATISGLRFTLDFLHDSAGNYFWATYSDSGRRDIRALIASVSTDIAQFVPEHVEIEMKGALFVYAESKVLFGVRIGAGIKLTGLPLVGSTFGEGTAGIDDLQMVIASKEFNGAEVKKLRGLISGDVGKLLDVAKSGGAQGGSQDDTTIVALNQGLNVGVKLKLGDTTRNLSLPVAAGSSTQANPSPGTTPTTQPAATAGTTTWLKIEKSLGPVYFERVGLQYRDATIWILLDAALRGAGLTLSLDGLAVYSPLGKLEPHFALQGLGMAFKRGDLEIGGALLQRPAPAVDAYDGALILRYKRLAIEAVGSYETIGGHPALFLYALIDYPLGGPAFFFVEGGALGFGYNRTFTMPTIEQVAEFPLIKQAMSRSEFKLTPIQLAEQLRPYVVPSVGDYFIAAGVKFTSFKTIKGFVLLTVLFGNHFEIDVLGKATLTSPSGVDSSKALMSATLLLLGRFLPEEGFFMVMAQLTPDSRLFAPDCHLTGGFAFCCWFGDQHKGDFVLTLGGYHKSFVVPDHYPKVPRLAMNWQVNGNLSLKAEAYFALTPSALMAGGKLEANWQSGDLQAWFRAEIDFLIGWQPFYYHGDAYIAIGARYRFEFFGKHEISAELTAKLEIWGPPFSGRARVQWNLLAFEVTFGEEPHPPEALGWTKFREAFLPNGRMFTATAEAGKVAQGAGGPRIDQGNLGCLNPRNLFIAVRSPLPIKNAGNELLRNASETPGRPSVTEPALGIAPMKKTPAEWKESLVTITIKGVNTREDVTSQFQATRIRNNVPASLWGDKMDPNERKKDDPQLLVDAICGYELRLSNPVKDPKAEAFTLEPTPRSVTVSGPDPAQPIKWKASSKAASEIAARLLAVEVRTKRSEILNELLPQIQVDWTSVTVASWRGTPSIVGRT